MAPVSTATKELPVIATPAAECCPPLTEAGMSAEEASGTAALFKALADPTRVQIVNLLANSPDEMCVCNINESFDLSQATLSHHLKKLVSAGLLSREQRGTWAFYSLKSDALRRLAEVVRPVEVTT